MILTKDQRFIPFEPNQVQRKYILDVTAREHDGGRPRWPAGLREMILKARQEGFSTLIDMDIFEATISTPNTNAVVIAHDEESTEKLFRAVRRAYDALPPHKKVPTSYSNKKELVWPSINSTFYVGTAGKRDFGRSAVIHYLHCTEVAFWDNAGDLMTGLLQAVPAGGRVWIETTANGIGNWFHREYSKAEGGRSTYTARFYAWFEHAEYRLDPAKAPALEPEDVEVEEALRKAHGLDEEQLAWRRAKKAEPGMRDKFPQEYPSNSKEAFLASGNPYFNRTRLEVLLARIGAPIVAADARARLAAFPRLVTAFDHGELLIYKLPTGGAAYVIGADTAEGLIDDGDADFDAADVLDVATWEQIATLHGQWDTHEFGLMLADLGRFYNMALVAPERNNHGHAVINAMIHTANYPLQTPVSPFGLYMHQEYDRKRKPEGEPLRPGWPENMKTKALCLDALATALEDDSLAINDPETIGELQAFNKLPGGKAGAVKGAHDDRVISLAIATVVLAGRPKPRIFTGSAGGRPSVPKLGSLIPR